MEHLTPENCETYARRHHNGMMELDFTEDYNRFRYVKRILNRYINGNNIKERLVLNHIQVIYNTFGVEATNRMLFLKMPLLHPQLCELLSVMSTLPETVEAVTHKGEDITTSKIKVDYKLRKLLQERI